MTDNPYLVPGTATLRNLLAITDPDELARFETNASVARIAQLLAGLQAPRPTRWDLEHLQAVHRHIFGDVYDWAGTIRTIAMSKGQDFHPLPNPSTPRASSTGSTPTTSSGASNERPSKRSRGIVGMCCVPFGRPLRHGRRRRCPDRGGLAQT